MKYQCIIVDDEIRARNILRSYIDDIPFLELKAEFKNAIEISEYIKLNNIDIVFLDINMPKITGIMASKMLVGVHIIFTTAYREFAVEGFEVNALDYLLKPFSFQRFLEAVQRIPRKEETYDIKSNAVYIDVKNGKNMQRVPVDEIIYIEGMSNYIKVVTVKESIVTYNKLSEITHHLPSYFYRVHRSYIINSFRIASYSKEHVEIEGKHIPIGITYRNQIWKCLNESSI